MTLEEKKTRIVELKAKLEELKAARQVKASKAGLEGAAARMMTEDPDKAIKWLGDSRTLDIREQQASRERGLGSSEEVRRQLRMNAERAAKSSRDTDLDKSVRARYLEEEAVYLAESEKDSPSLQAAAIAVGEIRRGKKAPGAEKVVGGGGDTGAVTYASALAKLKENMGKLKYADEATGIKPAFLEEIANLAEGDQHTLKGLFDAEAAKLPKRPVAKKRPAESTKEASTTALTALAQLIKWSEAGRLDPSVPADRLLLAKIKSRDYAAESYMSDDANLSASSVMQFFKNLTNIRELPLADAVKFKQEIPEKVRIAQEAVKVFLGDSYFDIVSKVLLDKLQAGLKNYPDRTQLLRDTAPAGGSKTEVKKIGGFSY